MGLSGRNRSRTRTSNTHNGKPVDPYTGMEMGAAAALRARRCGRRGHSPPWPMRDALFDAGFAASNRGADPARRGYAEFALQ